MRNKIFILLLISIFLISFASSTIYDIGTVKAGECINLIQTCSNCTYSNISTVLYPNMTQAIGESSMNKVGTVYNLTFCDTSTLGKYSVNGHSDLYGVDVVWAYYFTSTKSGNAVGGDVLTFAIIALFIFTVIGLFYTFLLGLAKLATADTTIYDVVLSWAFYILLMITSHLTATYILDTYFFDIADTLLTATVYTNGVLPLISFVVSYFIKSTQKKSNLSVREIAGRLS